MYTEKLDSDSKARVLKFELEKYQSHTLRLNAELPKLVPPPFLSDSDSDDEDDEGELAQAPPIASASSESASEVKSE